mmetsp:Transcript_21128/g.53999  ORF Transcript_21128/g.53999 Transcript_21128/m.53999 type:complete len:223 (-) Transcript_21128:1352-2020(-)
MVLRLSSPVFLPWTIMLNSCSNFALGGYVFSGLESFVTQFMRWLGCMATEDRMRILASLTFWISFSSPPPPPTGLAASSCCRYRAFTLSISSLSFAWMSYFGSAIISCMPRCMVRTEMASSSSVTSLIGSSVCLMPNSTRSYGLFSSVCRRRSSSSSPKKRMISGHSWARGESTRCRIVPRMGTRKASSRSSQARYSIRKPKSFSFQRRSGTGSSTHRRQFT